MMQSGFGWFAIVRMGLVQASLGAIVMLATSLLNRLMVVEFGLAAGIPAGLVAWHYAVQLSRPRWGQGSDKGRQRTPWILAGMALAAVFGGIANFLLLSTRVALEQFRYWNLGSLSASELSAVTTVSPLALLGLVLAALLCRQLTLMQMGDSQARALGISTTWVRVGVLLAATLLTACAIALAGPIGFVGFLAAYSARLLEPVGLLRQLLFSSLFGMLFLLTADILARWLVQPYELPVGTLLAALGAPALIAIVLRGGFRSLLAVK